MRLRLESALFLPSILSDRFPQLVVFRFRLARLWRALISSIYIYISISISVVFADYDKIENFMKIYAKMDPKSDPKIDVWAIRGPTFKVLGGFLRSLICDEFSIGETSA